MIISFIFVAFYSYCFGCVCGGYYLVKWRMNKDLRTLGSGTLGARNVNRILGLKWALLTIFIDAIKCIISVALTEYFFGYCPELIAASFIFTIVGQIFPVQLNFMGGKGVATFTGGLLFINLKGFLITFICAIIMHKLQIKPRVSVVFLALVSIVSTWYFLDNTILKASTTSMAVIIMLYNLKQSRLQV